MRHPTLYSILLSLIAVMAMAFSCRESGHAPSQSSLAGTRWEGRLVTEKHLSEPRSEETLMLHFPDEKHFTLGVGKVYLEGTYYYQEPALILRYSDESAGAKPRTLKERQPRAVLTMASDGELIGNPFPDRSPEKLRESYRFRRMESGK